MKNLIILFSMLLLFCTVSSCETQTVNDETGIEIEDIFGTNKEDVIAPGEEDETDEQ
jgi:hypothetical protein